jgi:dGTPase
MDHVRFVASAARTVARCLRLNEDLAEAIGLAHDVGHAPFGHQGEEFLTSIISRYPNLQRIMPRFSHEVYGLRVVDRIAKRDSERPGLNLTWEVRDGIISHWGEDYRTYRLDRASVGKDLETIQSREEAGNPATLEGCIVRLIDKIAYAGKDIEDAIEAEIIRKEDVPNELRKELGTTNGRIIGRFIEDMVANSVDRDYIAISAELGELLRQVIAFDLEHIYRSEQAEGFKTQANKGIQHLFDDLLRELCDKERFRTYKYPDPRSNQSVPEVYRVLWRFVHEDMKDAYAPDDPDELVILDFVAGMTDDFAMRSIGDVFIPKMII